MGEEVILGFDGAGLTVGDIPISPEVYKILFKPDPRQAILGEVIDETDRQDKKWGEQNHPDVRPGSSAVRGHYAAVADLWKAANAERARSGAISWDGILLEEVYEAFAEEDPVKLRAELVQSAAVIVQSIAAIDRRPST